MAIKAQRKAKAPAESYKVRPVKKARTSAPRKSSKANGKHPLTAYEHLHIGVVQATLDGKYVDVNEEFCRILGYSKTELLRLGVKDCTHEDDYGLDFKLHQQLVAGEIPFYGLEKRYVRKDGSIVWVELTRSLIRDEAGKPLCTIGGVIDISERKQVERVLRESVEHLRLATEAARMFKWEYDFQKQVYTLADNFTHVLGFSGGLLPQNHLETIWALSPTEDRQAISDVVAKAIENQEDLHGLQSRLINPQGGQVVWLEVNAKIVYDEAGNPVRMFGVAQNITARKRAQAEIQVISRMSADNPNPVMRLTPEGRVLYANGPASALLESWKQQGNQSIPDELQQCITAVFSSGSKEQIEIEHDDRVFACTLVPIREAGHVNFYGNDITERKLTGQALAEFARQQTALYQFSDELHHADSLEDIYNAALDAILSALQCHRASILLFDDTDVMRFVAWRGLSESYRKATQGHSPWIATEQNPEPICVNDIRTAGLSEALTATIQAEGIRSLAFIPLMANGRLIGKFMVYFNELHRCSDEELELSMTIARQLAFAVDRKRAEVELRESEERYRSIVSTANEGIWYIDLNAETIYLNEPMAQILGYSVPEVVGRKALEFCFDEDLLALQERIANNYQGKYENFDFRFRRKDGSAVLVLGSTSPVRDGAGNIIGALGMFVDVTERKQAEEALRESEERYRAVVESQVEMLCRFHPDGKILFVNDAYARARGTTPEALIQHDFWEFISEADRPAVRAMLETLTPQAPEVQIENRFQTAEGERWTLWTNHALRFDADGQLLEVQSSGIDITGRKRAEERLRESEERYRGIVNQTIGGIAETDLTGKFTMVNDRFCEITGYRREKLLEMRMQDVTHPDDLQRNLELFGQLTANSTSFEVEKRYVRSDGSIVWVHNSVSAIAGPDGKPQSAVAVVIDVSERKRAEEQLRQSAEFDAFRLALTDALRPLGDPEQILAAAMQVLGEKLQVDRVLYSEIEPDDETILILDNYVKAGVPRLTGRASLDDYGKARQPLSTGQNLIIADATTSPDMDEKDRSSFAALGIRSGLAIPLIKGGRWVATLGAHHGTPRAWTENEIKFMEETAERTWAALERARAQEKLRASEALYRTIARSIPGGGVYVVDKGFRYLVAEGPVTEAFGLSREMLEGRTVSEVFPDERGARLEERLRRNFAGETISFETKHEGRVFWTQLAPLQDSIGQAMILTLDITERKQAEEALRIENERFMRFVNSNIVGILIGDADGKVILANDYYLELLGVSRQDFLDKKVDWKKFTPPEWRATDEKAIRQLQERGVCEPYEKEYVRADGTRVPVYIADALLPGPGNEIAAFVLDITERKRAEEALRHSEERFVRFMQHLPGLAWIKDLQGRYIYANAAAEKAFNIPRERLYGKTDLELFPAEVAAEFRKNDRQALVSEKGMQTIETLQQDDGILHYSLISKFPIPGPDGSPALIAGTAFDVTERLQAEEALRESEARFRAIVNQATAGIVRKDAEGRLIFVNQAYCNMLGYAEADLLAKPFWEFTHPEDIEENKRLYDRMMVEGAPFKLEKRLIRADGSLIWVDVSVSPVMDAEGKPQSAVAVEVEITGRKQAEEALQQLNLQLESRVQKRTATIQAMNQSLREEIAERKRIEEALRQSEALARASEEKLRTLFDLLPVGISFVDPEGRVIEMNSALQNILRLSKKQILSQAYRSRKYIHVDGTAMSPHEFASARALAANKTVYNIEMGIVLENGEVVWASVSAAPVDVAGVGVVVVTVDITDSKRAERALQESHARLRFLSQRLVEVQEEERRALARELHDRVGQTLAALNINLIIINSQLSTDAALEIGPRLNDSMKLVAETIALVRDVMADLRPSVLDDYGLEAALESQLSKFTSRYDIKTVFDKPSFPIPRLGPSIEMTFLRIAQEALVNIARHAHAEHVSLTLKKREQAISLSIQDDGIGIESWQDANRPGSHGLTIMRERAEAFGGELKVKSVLGQGTLVEVSIPFRDGRAGPVEKETE